MFNWLHFIRSTLIQDPAILGNDITEIIDSKETNEVETDFSVNALNILHYRQIEENPADNYIPITGLELSEEFKKNNDSDEDVDKTIDPEEEAQAVNEVSEEATPGSKQCPDNLSACLSVCQPILEIRVLAFHYCERECRERCGGRGGENSSIVWDE